MILCLERSLISRLFGLLQHSDSPRSTIIGLLSLTLATDFSLRQVSAEDSSQDSGHSFNGPGAWPGHLGHHSPGAEVRSYVVSASRQVRPFLYCDI